MYNCKKIFTLNVMLCLVLLLSACGGADSETTSSPPASTIETSAQVERTVTDDFGHEITYPVQPQRILAPYLEDMLVALGVTPVAKYAAGGTVQEHLETWLKELPVIDLMAGISPEAVLGFEPDLIMISSHFLPLDKYETIAKIAPVYMIEEGKADWRENLRKVADLIGTPELAEQKLTEYDEKLAEAKKQLEQLGSDRTVSIVYPSEKEIFLIGSEFLSGRVVYDELGLKPHPLAAGTPDNFAQLSLEKLPDLNADELFVITPEGQTAEQALKLLENLPLWSTLPAVKNNRIHQVASGHWINNAYMANLSVIDDVLKALLQP